MAKIKDSELKAILAEVEQEIGDLLKTEKDKLAKAAPEDDDKSASPAASPEASSAAPADSAPPPPAAEGSAEAPEASMAAPGEAPADAHEEAGEIHPTDDLGQLQAEYEALSPEELKMHFMACKGAVEKLLGQGGEAGMDGAAAGAPPAPPAAPPAASPSAPPALKSEGGLEAVQPKGKLDGGEDHLAAMQPKGQISNGESHLEAVQPKGTLKGEMKASPGSGGEMLATKKHEDELAGLRKHFDDELNRVVDAVARYIGKPERKAVTSVSALGKTEEKKSLPQSRDEITERLKEMTGPDSKLSKKERQMVNSYCVGDIKFEQIEHLFTK